MSLEKKTLERFLKAPAHVIASSIAQAGVTCFAMAMVEDGDFVIEAIESSECFPVELLLEMKTARRFLGPVTTREMERAQAVLLLALDEAEKLATSPGRGDPRLASWRPESNW